MCRKTIQMQMQTMLALINSDMEYFTKSCIIHMYMMYIQEKYHSTFVLNSKFKGACHFKDYMQQ